MSFSPVGQAQVPVVHAEFPSEKSEISITQWQLLGPFPFESKEIEAIGAETSPVGLNRDYLKVFGVSEITVDENRFPTLKTPLAGVPIDSRFVNQLISAAPRTNILQLASDRHPMDYMVAYLAVTIESQNDQDIVIAAGVDDSMKVWLNHELIFTDLNTAHHFMKKFQRLIGARLRKGNNFLLLKTANLKRDWRLIVSLFLHGRSLELARDNAINPIMVSNVVPADNPLRLRGDLLSATTSVKVEIADAHHQIVDKAVLTLGREAPLPLTKLQKDNVYHCRFLIQGHVIEEPFYYGDLEASFRRLTQSAMLIGQIDDAATIDLETQLARLEHLLLADSRTSESWDQKVAASFAEVENNLAALGKGSQILLHAPGTHLRGYGSSVDGQIQHYWLHVPGQAQESDRPLPLVVVLPWTAFENLPFIKGYHVAAFDETERYRILGDEFGVAVLQVWGRGNNMGGTAIWTADVLEAIGEVSRNYKIDSDRIYLLGYCEGGRQALLLGERYPDRFAAIAVEGPITILRSHSPYGRLWLEYASPLAQVQNLVNTPVLISHEETDNPPIQDSESFAFRAREVGVDVTLIRTQNGEHGFSQDPMGVRRSMFKFFQGRQRNLSPHKVEVSAPLNRFGAGHGPIEDAFGAPVLLVEGSQGSSEQDLAVQNLAQNFRENWKHTYFVDCPMKRDVEVTDADIQKYNLIIFGDKDTNSLIHRMARTLPFETTSDGLSLVGKKYQGSSLGYEFIQPNPLNPRRYVVVIGINHWPAASKWKLLPSRDGIYDYFVFNLEGPAPRLMDAGYLDVKEWQRLITQNIEP